MITSTFNPFTRLLMLLAILLLSGCPQPQDPCEPPILSPQSVVINQVELLEPKFALRRTLQAIIDTSDGAETTPEALLASLLDDFRATEQLQRFSGNMLPVDLRDGESRLNPSVLLDESDAEKMVPIGLFNRLDLAAGDGTDCGEYRIVYGRPRGGKFFLIFEAILRNPSPGIGIEGCKRVNELWVSLSEMTPAEAVVKLESFYYDGLPGFDPVVTHGNYGLPLGQIRSNFFVRGPWQLREHKTSFDVNRRAILIPEPAKNTPLTEWFGAADRLPGTVSPDDQAAYRTAFLEGVLVNLVRPELDGAAGDSFKVVNGIAAKSPVDGDEFQSNAQVSVDDPGALLEETFRAQIETRVGELGVALTATQVINRSGAMTCAGCHRFSAGRDIGSGTMWPRDLGFVHIQENGSLSETLSEFFVPRRLEIATNFACPDRLAPVRTRFGALVDYDAIEQRKQAFLDARVNKSKAIERLAELNHAVDVVRKEYSQQPGAFVRARRTH